MKEDDLTTKYVVVAAMFKDSVSEVIPVAVDNLNMMVESEALRLSK